MIEFILNYLFGPCETDFPRGGTMAWAPTCTRTCSTSLNRQASWRGAAINSVTTGRDSRIAPSLHWVAD